MKSEHKPLKGKLISVAFGKKAIAFEDAKDAVAGLIEVLEAELNHLKIDVCLPHSKREMEYMGDKIETLSEDVERIKKWLPDCIK